MNQLEAGSLGSRTPPAPHQHPTSTPLAPHQQPPPLQGHSKLGMCGLSMGGVHACMTSALWPGDVACTPLLAPRSAAAAYCDGAMRPVTAWEALQRELDEAANEVRGAPGRASADVAG
jgi:hypothetical protein